jgi:hypothetical protein
MAAVPFALKLVALENCNNRGNPILHGSDTHDVTSPLP